LIKKLLKELQSSIGFYEVQTGQSVTQVMTTQLSPKLNWLDGVIANSLAVGSFKPDPIPWLQSRQITFSESAARAPQDPRWFGLLSLIAQYDVVHAVPAEEEK
jgi:hypothetical protein